MMVMGDGPPKERGRHRSKVENDIISRRERDFRHQQMWTGAVDYYKRWDKINTKFDEWTSPRYYEDNNKMLGDSSSTTRMSKQNTKVTLSKFFHEKDIDYKQNHLKHKLDTYEKTLVELQKVSESPIFRGFSKYERKEAERLVIRIELSRYKHSNQNAFYGFSSKDFKIARNIVENMTQRISRLKSSINNLLGFTQKEQALGISSVSKIIDACKQMNTFICSPKDIKYSKIRKKKMVCSKYWTKMQQQLVVEVEKCDTLEIKLEKGNTSRNRRSSVKLKEFPYQEKVTKDSTSFSNKEDTKSEAGDHHIFQIKKELVVPHFVPPHSPHQLLEEELYNDPWALLVATIFLNKTSCWMARPYVFWFLEDHPDPFAVITKSVASLEKYFNVLGLQKTRALQVWRMSYDFIYKNWNNVSDLYGIGRYGEDAFRMFCVGDFSIEPQDRYLKIYKAWYEMQEKETRMNEMNSSQYKHD